MHRLVEDVVQFGFRYHYTINCHSRLVVK
jgi:hypothetical protein